MNKLNYFSTRDTKKSFPKTSAEVIKQGIAEDGGLFMPESIPSITLDEIKSLCSLSYIDRAAAILSKYLTDYTADELHSAAASAYSAEKFGDHAAPVVKLGETQRVLELWHGPTSAFKDMALQIMPHLLSMALKKTGEKREALILVATSGDTGKAALDGYADVPGVKIAVFYPEDGVSDMQKLQMTSQKGDNVFVSAIKGNFDDAQTGVKQIFADDKIASDLHQKGLFLSSANSINWGRLAPQIVYYISAYCDLVLSKDISLGDEIDVTVPTGNFGNIFAAYLAKRMGLPLRKLICASNKNNILTDFLKTGVYDRNRDFYTTMSPSMDILISSNLERLLFTIAGSEKTVDYMSSLNKTGRYAVSDDVLSEIQTVFSAQYCGEADCAATIRKVWEQNYLIDPHTAVALYASLLAENENKKEGREVKILTASTASPYKFATDVLKSLGENSIPQDFSVIYALNKKTASAVPAPLAALKDAKVRFTGSVGKEKESLWQAVTSFIAQ